MTRALDWEEIIFSNASQTSREDVKPTKDGTRDSDMVETRTLKSSWSILNQEAYLGLGTKIVGEEGEAKYFEGAAESLSTWWRILLPFM